VISLSLLVSYLHTPLICSDDTETFGLEYPRPRPLTNQQFPLAV
jgi:hypothetical protein